MNNYEKILSLQNFSKKLRSDQRITLSHENTLSLDSLFSEEQKRSYKEKPLGLWYGFGNNWLNFLIDGLFFGIREWDRCWFDSKVKQITHIYKLKVDSSIYKINDSKSLSFFEKLYADKYKENINWLKVAKTYSGIEIKLPKFEIDGILDDSYWAWGWDINSGCIWDKKAIKEIKLIKYWEPIWQEF